MKIFSLINLFIVPVLLVYYWITLDIPKGSMVLITVWGVNSWMNSMERLLKQGE